MKYIAFFCCLSLPHFMMAQNNYTKLSQEILYAVKTDTPTDELEKKLAAGNSTQLTTELNNDAVRKAFWLNIYNAFTQIRLKQNPDAYKKRDQFFTTKNIGIAGELISLDIIEHGILRKSQAKLGMGYFRKLFTSSFEKQSRVDTQDYRIHFALNCGAKSCPPIAFYQPEKIDQQLALATKAFLKSDSEFDAATNTVILSKIFSWFRGDFGGKKGIIKLLQEQELIPKNKKVKLKWRPYNWALTLNAYS